MGSTHPELQAFPSPLHPSPYATQWMAGRGVGVVKSGDRHPGPSLFLYSFPPLPQPPPPAFGPQRVKEGRSQVPDVSHWSWAPGGASPRLVLGASPIARATEATSLWQCWEAAQSLFPGSATCLLLQPILIWSQVRGFSSFCASPPKRVPLLLFLNPTNHQWTILQLC